MTAGQLERPRCPSRPDACGARHAHRRGRGRHPQGQPQGLTVVCLLDEGAGGRRVHRKTASAPPRCRCAASTWPAAPGCVPWSSTPAMPTRAPAQTAWPAPARPACAGIGLLVTPRQVLPFSTGVIMEPLPHERIEAGLPAAHGRCAGRALAARRRRHHDHRHRAQGRQRARAHRRRQVTVTGISKGAGMIRPNMATMLGFMATDARVDAG
jgi:hypothetical protein